MMAVTVGGQAGAGGVEIGQMVAKQLDAMYVQKQAIRRVARELDATVDAVVRKELAYYSRWKRFGHQLEAWLAQMGRTWAGDAWSSTGIYATQLISDNEKRDLPGLISDEEYKETVFSVAERYLAEGNVVLAHRAGCLTLQHRDAAVHVGVFAPKNSRIARVSHRFRIGNQEAEEWVDTMDQARAAWYQHLADKDPQDRSIYDIALDVSDIGDKAAAEIVSKAAMEQRFNVTSETHQTLPH